MEHARGSYGAAKAAVAAWTVGLSSIPGSRGITVNTVSPGPIVDTDAVIAALNSGRLAYAGFDVYDKEPLRIDHPLRRTPNVPGQRWG